MTPRLLAATAVAVAVPGFALAQDAARRSATASTSPRTTSTAAPPSPTTSRRCRAMPRGSYGIFYAGVWASTVDGESVDIDPDDRFEFDLSAGIRPTFGDLWLDLNYTRYIYDNSGDCCGDIIVDRRLSGRRLHRGRRRGRLGSRSRDDLDRGRLRPHLRRGLGWSAARSAPTSAPKSGASGTRSPSNVGVSRSLGDIGTVDLRYHDFELRPRPRRALDRRRLLAPVPREAAARVERVQIHVVAHVALRRL